ncbi:MAG: hypothetical protein HN368_01275, partial [Spirochaetales bacterium]|nr:hypothetical protein [Spirochaetales bacterium]
ELLFRTADTAIEEISGAEEIAALYVFAGLRTGRIELAYQKADKLLKSDAWLTIKNEAVLRKHALDGNLVGDKKDLILAASISRDPLILERAAAAFNEPGFALDAALLLAGRGEVYQASLTIGEPAGLLKYPALLFAYDSERFGHALSITRSFTEEELDIKLLAADLYLRLGMFLEAEHFYSYIITQSPDLSWIPYVNMTYLLIESGLLSEAREMITAGLNLFADSRILKVAEIEVMLYAGEVDKAISLLDLYRETFPENLDLALLAYRIAPSHANRLRLSSLLWEIFLREPEDRRSAAYLAGFLLASGDSAGLNKMLDTWNRENGETEWSRFLLATKALIQSDADTALIEYERAWTLNPRWQTAYNLALIAHYRLDYEGALEYLRMAESALDRETKQNDSDKAAIRMRMAVNLYAQGNYDAARREALYASDLDLDVDGAGLLLKQLESRAN